MAVGLGQNRFFTNTTQTFDINSNIEMIECKINNQIVNNNYSNHTLTFNFKLNNGDKCNIYFKYKKKRNDIHSKVANKFHVGISNIFSGYKGKFIMKLHNNIEVVNFEQDFFKKKNDNYYYYFGEIPNEGLMTCTYFSKKKAKWKLIHRVKTKNIGGYSINNVTAYCPEVFKGGNNEIINLKIVSNHIDKVDNDLIKLENGIYYARYANNEINKGFFDQQVLLYNYCNKVWECNKDVIIPDDEKNNKNTFVSLVNKIKFENKENIPLYREFKLN